MDNPVLQAAAGIILLVLTGLGIKQAKKNGESEEITPDSKPTRRDTILMLMTDRIHKVREEVQPMLGKLQLEDAKMDLRITQNRDDIIRLQTEVSESFKAVHIHLNDRCDRIEDQIKTSIDRIWSKLDKSQ